MGTDVCPMNSADRHSLQFTKNKIVYKIFGAMSHFGRVPASTGLKAGMSPLPGGR